MQMMFYGHVFRFLCLLFLLPLYPCTCVPGPQCLGACLGETRVVLLCGDTNAPPASSISSLFSVLMLQWSSSALSTVTPKQLLDSFTFIVICQTHWA